MADKVLPQRVSAASVRGEGAELLEGGGESLLPSQGSRGGEVPTRRRRRRISLSCLPPAGHFCSVPNHLGRFPSLPLGWQERFGAHTNWTSRTLGKRGVAAWDGDPRRTLSLSWESPVTIRYPPVTPGGLLGTVTGSKLRSAVQLCALRRGLPGCSLHLK